jgi:hypothetical protein
MFVYKDLIKRKHVQYLSTLTNKLYYSLTNIVLYLCIGLLF